MTQPITTGNIPTALTQGRRRRMAAKKPTASSGVTLGSVTKKLLAKGLTPKQANAFAKQAVKRSTGAAKKRGK